MHKAIVFLLICGAAGAEDLRFAGPLTGFLYDAPSRSIRVIQGVPGSSYLGTAVLQNIDFASIAPNGRSALVWSGGVASFVARLDLDAATREIGAAGVPDQIAWSPDSRSIVLYRAVDSRLERWRGLDDAPAIDSPDGLRVEGRISFVAIDASASRIAWGSEVGLVLWIDGRDAQSFPEAGSTTGGVFATDGKTLFAAGSDRIVALRNIEWGPYTDFLGIGTGDPLDAAGMAVDASGHLYVADRAAQSMRVYDTATGGMTVRIALDLAPSMMIPLLRRNTFLLNVRTGATDPVWVFDTSTRNSAYFVGMGVE